MSKKLFEFILLMLILLIAFEVLAQQSPSLILNTDYYNATRYNNNRKCARTTDGILMVVWEPNGNPNKEVWYSIYDATFEAWGDPIQLSNSEKGDTGCPGLVADNKGNIYACWKQYNNKTPLNDRRDFMFAKWNGAAWSEPVAVESDTGNAGFGSMALAPDGTIFIAYSDFGNLYGPQNIHICWSKDDGVTWEHQNVTQFEALYGDYIEPCLTHGPHGTMICAWFDEPDTLNKTDFDEYPLKEIIISVFDGTTWSEPFIVTSMLSEGDTLSAQFPTMITDSKNRVHVIYTIDENSLHHSLWDGSQLSAPVRIDESADTLQIGRASLSVDDNDNLHVVWQEQTIKSEQGNVDNAFYSISTDGGQTWMPPVQMSNCRAEDGSGHSVEWPSIGRAIRSPIENVFEGGADVIWVQYNAASEFGWDLMYYRIPLVSSTAVDAHYSPPVDGFTLTQNYPNPFNSQTAIEFKLPEASKVEMVIYNNLGQKVKHLVNHHLSPGTHTYYWNGTNRIGAAVPSGIYYYKISTQKFSVAKEMVFLR